jgi:hypothetical protein
MASLRSCFFDICSADSFEDFTEIHGFGEILFVHILLPIRSRISHKIVASNYEIFVCSKFLLQIVSSGI